jgi:hypothetical protein
MNCVLLLVFSPSQICSQTEPALSGRYGQNESKAGTKSALTPSSYTNNSHSHCAGFSCHYR